MKMMGETNDLDPNLIPFAADERRRTEDPYVSELLKGLVSSFRELEQKNKELEQRNAELLAELQQANGRVTRLTEGRSGDPEAGVAAFKMAAEILQNAEHTVGSLRLAAKVETNNRYEEVTRRVLEVQSDLLSLLQRTREENAHLNQDASEKAIDVLLESKNSILSMVESLDRTIVEQTPEAPTEPDEKVTPIVPFQKAISLDQAPKPSEPMPGVPSSEAAQDDTGKATRSSLASKVADALRASYNGNGATHPRETHLETSDLLTWPGRLPAGPAPVAPPTTNGRTNGHSAEALRTAEVAEPTVPVRSVNGRINSNHAEALPTADVAEPAVPVRSVRLIASGVRSFSDLAAFHRAVQQLPGVVSAQAESFGGGTIHLRVRHRNPGPLQDALIQMPHFRLRMVSITTDQVEVAVV